MNSFQKRFSGPVIADGAMGTYFSAVTGDSPSGCELACRTQPDVIRSIHREYLAAGAGFLRSNTFAANTAALELPLGEVCDICRAGYRLARECAAGAGAVAAADIGPIHGEEDAETRREYKALIDAFLEEGADAFCLETFAEYEPAAFCAAYIKEKAPGAFVLASFSFAADGMTRRGLSLEGIYEACRTDDNIDCFGLNCGVGPSPMLELARRLTPFAKPVAVMPNAGYPAAENDRMVFAAPPEYFAEVTSRFQELSVSILGGCCGTTPAHIRRLARMEGKANGGTPAPEAKRQVPRREAARRDNRFLRKLTAGEFTVVAELSPPQNSDLQKTVENARLLAAAGVDAITISDSPLAKVRLDSVTCAAKIMRETGADVLPHLCCRDRNINALRAGLLAAHAEGIRAVLGVSGDAIPEGDRGYVKPVFNVNSMGLISIVSQMNGDVFRGDPVTCGCAFNHTVRNVEVELSRLQKKKESGAVFALTQPVFSKDSAELLRRAQETGMKVFCGIMPLVSRRNALFLHNEMPGFFIPEEYRNRFSDDMSREEAAEEGLRIAEELALALRQSCDGFYFVTPFSRAGLICELLCRLRKNGCL